MNDRRAMLGGHVDGGGQRRQDIRAERDAFAAGRDQILNITGRSDPDSAPGLLPRDVPVFTGRVDELARLKKLATGASVVVTAIDGTAGVGKTALAIHAAHHLMKSFPDGHLYADMR